MKKGVYSAALLTSALVCFTAIVISVAPARDARAQDANPPQAVPDQPRPRGDGPPGRRPDGPPSVERAMKGMNRALKTLHSQIKDESKLQENLQLISDAQRACVGAKGQPAPDDILEKAKDEAAKKELSKTYRRDLIRALKKLVEIEEGLLDGKSDAAAAALEEVIKLRDEAHKAMGVKDDD